MDQEQIEKMKVKLRVQVEKMARQVDFEALEKAGVVTKEGAWYRVHSMSKLPEHARVKITSVIQDTKGLKVKFSKVTKAIEKMAAQLRLT